MKKKIALFDFDKTIINNDSLYLLWKYAIKEKKINKLYFINKILSGSIKYISTNNSINFKNEMCSILNFLNEADLIKFFDYIFENHIYKDSLDEFNSLNDSIKILSSASPINYLKYIKKHMDFDIIIGTELDENYKVKDENNKYEIKPIKIKKILKENNIEIDYENSSAYSDSYKSDRYMLELVKNRFLINAKNIEKDCINLKWR